MDSGRVGDRQTPSAHPDDLTELLDVLRELKDLGAPHEVPCIICALSEGYFCDDHDG
jgi:hypothetical protein